MKIRTAVLFALATVALAGCAVGPDYHPPKTQAPANWSEAQLGGATNSAVQIVEWWKTFNDPELNSLVERAVAANYDLRIAEGRLHEARALRSGAFFDLGPTINGWRGLYRRAAIQELASVQHLGPAGQHHHQQLSVPNRPL